MSEDNFLNPGMAQRSVDMIYDHELKCMVPYKSNPYKDYTFVVQPCRGDFDTVYFKGTLYGKDNIEIKCFSGFMRPKLLGMRLEQMLFNHLKSLRARMPKEDFWTTG